MRRLMIALCVIGVTAGGIGYAGGTDGTGAAGAAPAAQTAAPKHAKSHHKTRAHRKHAGRTPRKAGHGHKGTHGKGKARGATVRV